MRKIEEIHTEDEYEEVLQLIEDLWDPEPGTPEFRDFERLVDLVVKYEDIHYRIDPPNYES